jgi:hypothetical protein
MVKGLFVLIYSLLFVAISFISIWIQRVKHYFNFRSLIVWLKTKVMTLQLEVLGTWHFVLCIFLLLHAWDRTSNTAQLFLSLTAYTVRGLETMWVVVWLNLFGHYLSDCLFWQMFIWNDPIIFSSNVVPAIDICNRCVRLLLLWTTAEDRLTLSSNNCFPYIGLQKADLMSCSVYTGIQVFNMYDVRSFSSTKGQLSPIVMTMWPPGKTWSAEPPATEL